jgi:hypothetical protein
VSARTKSFAGEAWTVEAGRSIVTPDGHFYLTYGRDDKTSAPHYRDFCKLDDIAASMPLLPQIDTLRAENERLREALRDIYEQPIGHTAKDCAHDLAAVIRIARAALAGSGNS